MIEKKVNYPACQARNEKVLAMKATVYFDAEQILEIANVFYYVNLVQAKLPGFLGGIKLSEAKRALHKSIHDAAVNCVLSLEEYERCEKEKSAL